MKKKIIDTKSDLLEHAPLHLFWIFRDDPRTGLIHYLGEDGIAYILMDDDDERVERCINFLLDKNCPVFDDTNKMDEYIEKLTGTN